MDSLLHPRNQNNQINQTKSQSSSSKPSSQSSSSNSANHSRRNSTDQIFAIIPKKSNVPTLSKNLPYNNQKHDISTFYYIAGICRELIIVSFSLISVIFCAFFIYSIFHTLISTMSEKRYILKKYSQKEKKYNCSKVNDKSSLPFINKKCDKYKEKKANVTQKYQIHVLDIASENLSRAINTFSNALGLYAIVFLVVILIISLFIRH